MQKVYHRSERLAQGGQIGLGDLPNACNHTLAGLLAHLNFEDA